MTVSRSSHPMIRRASLPKSSKPAKTSAKKTATKKEGTSAAAGKSPVKISVTHTDTVESIDVDAPSNKQSKGGAAPKDKFSTHKTTPVANLAQASELAVVKKNALKEGSLRRVETRKAPQSKKADQAKEAPQSKKEMKTRPGSIMRAAPAGTATQRNTAKGDLKTSPAFSKPVSVQVKSKKTPTVSGKAKSKKTTQSEKALSEWAKKHGPLQLNKKAGRYETTSKNERLQKNQKNLIQRKERRRAENTQKNRLKERTEEGVRKVFKREAVTQKGIRFKQMSAEADLKVATHEENLNTGTAKKATKLKVNFTKTKEVTSVKDVLVKGVSMKHGAQKTVIVKKSEKSIAAQKSERVLTREFKAFDLQKLAESHEVKKIPSKSTVVKMDVVSMPKANVTAKESSHALKAFKKISAKQQVKHKKTVLKPNFKDLSKPAGKNEATASGINLVAAMKGMSSSEILQLIGSESKPKLLKRMAGLMKNNINSPNSWKASKPLRDIYKITHAVNLNSIAKLSKAKAQRSTSQLGQPLNLPFERLKLKKTLELTLPKLELNEDLKLAILLATTPIALLNPANIQIPSESQDAIAEMSTVLEEMGVDVQDLDVVGDSGMDDDADEGGAEEEIEVEVEVEA